MPTIKLLIPIVLLLSILQFHINNGLISLIVFPTIIITLLLTILLLVNLDLNYIKYIIIINVATTIAFLSYSLIPYSIGDRYPDANYILQLVKLFSSEKMIMLGAGTNAAYDYSFYPLFETWIIILSYYSEVNPIFIMRMYPTFAILYYFVTWVSIYKFISRQNYSEAVLTSLLSFHFSTFLIRPVHPAYAYMLFSLLFLILVIVIFRGYKFNFLIMSTFVITGIIMSHNTTGLILIVTLLLFFLVNIGLDRLLGFTFFIDSQTMKKVLSIFFIILIIFLLYNLYVSTYFFSKGTLGGFISYISYILRGDILPLDVIFGFRRPISIESLAPSFLGWVIDRGRIILGYIGLAIYFIVFLFVVVHIFYKHSFNFTSVSSLFFILSLSIILLLIVSTLTWPAFYISDYYWRYYSYFFFFSSPIVVLYICKLRKRIAIFLFFVILLNTLLWKPSLAFGVDTPFELSDPRIGIKESVVLASYLAERYDGSVIVGTRYAFNVIGPLSVKTTITIYSDKDLEMPSIKGTRTYLFVFSSIETKMLRISTNVNEGNLLYQSGKFFVYK